MWKMFKESKKIPSLYGITVRTILTLVVSPIIYRNRIFMNKSFDAGNYFSPMYIGT